MKTKLSRLTAVLLVLCMCASLFTVTAFANNPEVITVTPNPASVTDSGDVELTAFLTISETWAKQFAVATEDFRFALTLSYPSDKGSLAVKTGPAITDGSDLFEVTSTDTNTAGKIVINCKVKETAVEGKTAKQIKELFIGKEVTFNGTATITVTYTYNNGKTISQNFTVTVAIPTDITEISADNNDDENSSIYTLDRKYVGKSTHK